jgi:heme o synthase
MTFTDFLSLSKIKITIPVALSGFTGFLMYNRATDGAVWPVLGILLLAMGSAVLNHIDEYALDAQMLRTADRPLPSGRVSLPSAQWLALLLLLCGSILLLLVSGLISCFLGLLTLVWYNGIYTFLKRKTAWAVIPGSLVGALPPVIGYTAAGGDPLDPLILFLSAFFFVAQIPHFWILLLAYGDDYLKAGFKSLSTVFNAAQLRLITFSWVLSTAMIAALFGTALVINSLNLLYIISACSFVLVAAMFYLLMIRKTVNVRLLFSLFNGYIMLVMILLWVDILWL